MTANNQNPSFNDNLYDVVMPKLGESVTEGRIISWLVAVGDQVEEYQNILEVETAKVVAEVPVVAAGEVVELLYQEGETVKVGAVICRIKQSGVEIATSSSASLNSTSQENATNQQLSQATTLSSQDSLSTPTKPSTVAFTTEKVRFSPAVLLLSQTHGINLSSLQGTGAGGRVTRKDLEALIKSGGQSTASDKTFSPGKPTNAPNILTSTANRTASVAEDFEALTEDKMLPLTPMRHAIAKKMVESVSSIPHAWMSVEADVTKLVNFRNSIKDDFLAHHGYSLPYYAFFIVEVAKSLKKFPLLNSSWIEGEGILLKKDINISIAIAVGNSLFVPVIRNADTKSIREIAQEVNLLVQKARASALTVADMQGGTFTVNNSGSIGAVSSMGIINHPQAAILQVEALRRIPVVVNQDSIAIRDVLNLSLSLDHRIVDGYIAGKFVNSIKNSIEDAQYIYEQL